MIVSEIVDAREPTSTIPDWRIIGWVNLNCSQRYELEGPKG
jgi:hypothetical protein